MYLNQNSALGSFACFEVAWVVRQAKVPVFEALSLSCGIVHNVSA